MEETEIAFLTTIARRETEEQIVDKLSEIGGKFYHVLYGRGISKGNAFKHSLGFTDENPMVIIVCIINKHKVQDAIKMLEKDFDFDKYDHGIAFTIPITSIKF